MSRTHTLKTVDPFFWDVWLGKKKFEVRRNDRNYQVGDDLVLRQYDPENDEYSGRRIFATVQYILTANDYPDGLNPEYVVLGIVVTGQEVS